MWHTFRPITMFGVPYRLTSAKGGSHTWFTNTWISIWCIFEACMSLTLRRSSVVQHFVRGNVLKVFDRIIVNFYTRLSHVHLWSKQANIHMHMCNAVMWVWDSLNNTISFVFRLSNMLEAYYLQGWSAVRFSTNPKISSSHLTSFPGFLALEHEHWCREAWEWS